MKKTSKIETQAAKDFHNKNCVGKSKRYWKWQGSPYVSHKNGGPYFSAEAYKCELCGIEVYEIQENQDDPIRKEVVGIHE